MTPEEIGRHEIRVKEGSGALDAESTVARQRRGARSAKQAHALVEDVINQESSSVAVRQGPADGGTGHDLDRTSGGGSGHETGSAPRRCVQ